MTQQRPSMGKRVQHEAEPDAVRIKYQRSNEYRVVHVDGAWGGLTPQGNIHMGLFNEFRDHPDFVSFRAQDGHLSEVSREGPQFMLRQIEVEAIISPSVARSLIEWLTGRLELLEQFRAAAILSNTDTSDTETTAEEEQSQ